MYKKRQYVRHNKDLSNDNTCTWFVYAYSAVVRLGYIFRPHRIILTLKQVALMHGIFWREINRRSDVGAPILSLLNI